MLLNKVTLIHSADSSHSCAHSSRLDTKPGEFVKYFSAFISHALSENVPAPAVVVVIVVVVVVVGALVVVVVVVVGALVVVVVVVVVGLAVVVVVVVVTMILGPRMTKGIASLTFLTFVHAVLT